MAASRKARGFVWRLAGGATAAALLLPLGALTGLAPARADTTARYIVADQAGVDSTVAAADVVAVGGTVDAPLDAADAVEADLTGTQVGLLQAIPTVTVTPDAVVSMASTTGGSGRAPAAVFPQQSGATQLWAKGVSGLKTNVAVLDTGIDNLPDFAGRLLPGVDLSGEGNPNLDSYGHGTFVAGLVAGNGAGSSGVYKGEAPGTGVVPVKVAGASGQTDLATVIAGIQWVITHRASEGIRVLNLSLGYAPVESTLVNPLDQAVERAWDAGITVVASAGNYGPFNGTVLSPGDDPLVITVGSVDDQGSISAAGDTMSTFSSVGPTDPDGWLKPDLVTSGRSVVSVRAPGSTVDVQNPSAVVGSANFVGSGTSFSAAVVSGAAALLLSDHPNLQPSDVKAALLGTAAPGPVGNPVVDGHGLLNVAAADSAGGMHLTQSAGGVDLTQSVPGGMAPVVPGSIVSAGYSFQMGGNHPAAVVSLLGGQLSLPVACAPGGPAQGAVSVSVTAAPVSIPAGSNATLPSSSALEGFATAPDLCSGRLMYPTGANGSVATFTGSLTSTDTTDSVQLQFRYSVAPLSLQQGTKASVVPVAVTQMGDTVDLGTTWAGSSWNGSHWSGLSIPATSGSSWSGSSWSGSAWNGSSWSGSSWSGSKWSGSKWSGSKWSGSSWSGSSWSGSKWSGSSWSGSSWGADAGSGADSTSTAPAATSSSPYPGYQLVSTGPDLWCPQGVNLGNPGKAGSTPSNNGGQGAPAGAAGCGSNGGNGGNGGNGDARGGAGGNGGNGGNGGCPASTDDQMAAGQFPCNGSGANGGNGGNGGNSNNGTNGGPGGNGGNGGNAQGAAGGAGGPGGAAQSGVAGGPGGNGGNGGGCSLYTPSYWVSCPSHGGQGGKGGQANAPYAGGAGGNGGASGTAVNTNGGNGGAGGNAGASQPGSNGQDGTSGGTSPGSSGLNGSNGLNG